VGTEPGVGTERPPEVLAHRAADWFEALRQHPVVLWLWCSTGRRGRAPRYYAGRYEFADTADVLAERYDHDRAPAAQTARIREAGYFVDHANHLLLTTETLTQPDAFRFIRGDRSAAGIPDTLREVPVGDISEIFTGEGTWLGSDFRWDTRRAHDLGLHGRRRSEH
jgi:hypothetical protein